MHSKSITSIALSMAAAGTLTALALAQQSDLKEQRPERPKESVQANQTPPTAPEQTVDWLGAPAQRSGEYDLTLGEQRFTPGPVIPQPPIGWDRSDDDPDGNNLRLLQFTGPIQEQWLDAVKGAGVDLVQYIHPYAYIVWADEASHDAASNLPNVRWAGEFYPAYRVLPPYRNLGQEMTDVRVMLYRGADTEAALQAMREIGAHFNGASAIDSTFEIATFKMTGDMVQQAAQVPGVYSIKPVPTNGGLRGEMTNQLNVGNYDNNNEAFPGYSSYLSTVGVDGSGVIMANVDGGVQDSHPDLTGQFVPCSGVSCSTGSSGHGTHTAGIMAATGASGTTDSFGFLRGLGMAPGAQLVEQQYSPTFTSPGGMLQLMTDSYNNGAVLSSNSWGPAGTPQGYDDDTRQVDVGVRDAVPNQPGNQPLTYVLAFMNGNGGTSTQGSPDEAKNLFNIGSSKGQTSSGAQILQIDDLSSNTAHGPALDGRTIPHMVAPGCQVDSTYTGSGYDLLCGTSMACPHAAGAIGLFIEYYRNLPDYTVDPSPALIKAAFLPVAHDLAGNDDADGATLGHPFDNKQGWGRMNVDAVINGDPNGIRYFDNPVVFDSTGEEWSTTVSPLDPDEPMKIMLVWTDAPGHGLGGSTPAWNNDLDLIVEAGGTYRGNNFGGDGFSVTGGSADTMNNTEGVFLGPNPPGGATIRVVASNINSDGVPSVGDDTDQDFALACYNCALEPGFIVSANPSAQEICAPGGAQYDVNVDEILGFSDPVTLSALNLPSGVTANFSQNPVTPPASLSVTLNVSGSTAYGDYSIEIEGVSGSTERSTSIGLHVANANPGAASLASPADGESGVGLAPTYQWSAASQADEYDVEVASDAGFTNIVDSASVTGTSYNAQTALSSLTTYYWRVRATNTCGIGSWTSGSFTTLEAPSILIVDDDDNSPNVMSFYEDTLNAMGFTYDVWDTNNSDDEPDALTLAQYRVVIWFTGDEWGGSSGPGTSGESALAEWLDTGGCLFLTSQDYHYDRGLTSFMQNYLGVGNVDDDEDQNSVAGEGVFAGLGPYTLSYPFTNFADIVNPSASGEVAFTGNGNAGVSKDGGDYRTVFIGYPLESIDTASDRAAVLLSFVDWCDEIFEQPCPADLDGNQTVDVFDLLELLNNWGGDGPGSDLDEPNNVVDVFDMLALLNAWGDC